MANLLKQGIFVVRGNIQGGRALLIGAAVAVGMVSIFTFRLADGFAFSISTLVACVLVYFLGSRYENSS